MFVLKKVAYNLKFQRYKVIYKMYLQSISKIVILKEIRTVFICKQINIRYILKLA